jgi:hypothetical protein
MSKLKHTPGKWKIVDDQITLQIYNIHQECSEKPIAMVYREYETDALLISQAPDMLEALIKSIRKHTICDDSWYSCPLSEEGSIDESKGDKCLCGADDWNNYVIPIIERATGMKIEEVINHE